MMTNISETIDSFTNFHIDLCLHIKTKRKADYDVVLFYYQMRQSRVHAEQDSDMPADGISLAQQQQRLQQVVVSASNTSLQREVSQSTLTHAAAVNGDKSALSKLINSK